VSREAEGLRFWICAAMSRQKAVGKFRAARFAFSFYLLLVTLVSEMMTYLYARMGVGFKKKMRFTK
jgi:hypothetical protein